MKFLGRYAGTCCCCWWMDKNIAAWQAQAGSARLLPGWDCDGFLLHLTSLTAIPFRLHLICFYATVYPSIRTCTFQRTLIFIETKFAFALFTECKEKPSLKEQTPVILKRHFGLESRCGDIRLMHRQRVDDLSSFGSTAGAENGQREESLASGASYEYFLPTIVPALSLLQLSIKEMKLI